MNDQKTSKSGIAFVTIPKGEGLAALGLIPFRNDPVHILLNVDPDTGDIEDGLGRRFAAADDADWADHWAIKAFRDLPSHYSWTTPERRMLCADLGLDPDFKRPSFHEAFADVAEKLLMVAASRGYEDDPLPRPDRYDYKNYLHDVLDIPRILGGGRGTGLVSGIPNSASSLVDQVRYTFDRWKAQPEALLIRAILNRYDTLIAEHPEMVDEAGCYAGIRFLPSAAGTGYHASLYGGHEPAAQYLWGIALSPDHKSGPDGGAYAMRLVARFPAIVWLGIEEAKAYLASEEAAYFAGEYGASHTVGGEHLEAREATPEERRQWQKTPPATPQADLYIARLANLRGVDVETLRAWRHKPPRDWLGKFRSRLPTSGLR